MDKQYISIDELVKLSAEGGLDERISGEPRLAKAFSKLSAADRAALMGLLGDRASLEKLLADPRAAQMINSLMKGGK